MWIDAKEPEQFKDELMQAYKRDDEGLTDVYARGSNRFFIIKKQPVKSLRGYFNKKHVLRLLNIMNMSHGLKHLETVEKIMVSKVIDKEVKKADRTFAANRTTTGTQARAVYWST